MCSSFVAGDYIGNDVLSGNNNIYNTLELKKWLLTHRRPEGGATWGSCPAPLEFENDDVICCFRAKYPKIFARALGARIDRS